MSKGSPIVPIRVPPGLLEDLDIKIEELNERTRGTPFNRTSFIIKAIREKIDHIHRSRRKTRNHTTHKETPHEPVSIPE